MTCLGIDIGGTGIQFGIVDRHGQLLELVSVPTTSDSEALIASVIEAARPLVAAHQPRAVGIGSAGRIDCASGTVLRAGNLPFQNEPLCRRLSDALGLSAVIDNDANCALIAEARVGACADHRDALMVTIGTGIGGAILIDGQLYRAHNFRAGEFGHFIYDRGGVPCPCGLHGCFEQYASATALIREATAAAEQHPDSLLAASRPLNGKAIFKAAADGCPAASEVLDRYAATLADGLNSLVKIFMPTCIVLGGGIANAGEALLSRVAPHLLPEAVIRTSALGGNAGVIGAAFLAMDTVAP